MGLYVWQQVQMLSQGAAQLIKASSLMKAHNEVAIYLPESIRRIFEGSPDKHRNKDTRQNHTQVDTEKSLQIKEQIWTQDTTTQMQKQTWAQDKTTYTQK